MEAVTMICSVFRDGLSVAGKMCVFAVVFLQPGFCQAVPPPSQEDIQVAKCRDSLTAARSESVEIEAYIFHQLKETGCRFPPKLLAEENDRLSQRTVTAEVWYPRFPATSTIPDGYSGVVAAMKFRLSGLEILLDTLKTDDPASAIKARRVLAELRKVQPVKPTCQAPYLSSRFSLYRYLVLNGKSLYPGRDEQFDLFSRLGSEIGSPHDLAGFAELTSSFEFRDSAGFDGAVSQIVAALFRVVSPPCGSVLLIRQMGLPVTIDRLAKGVKARGQSPWALLSAYREFAVRSLGAPICRAASGTTNTPDPNEANARLLLADSVNAEIAELHLDGLPLIDKDALQELQADRKVLDEKPVSFPTDPQVETSLRSLQGYFRSPALAGEKRGDLVAGVEAFLTGWRAWTPPSSDDFRVVDGKVTSLEMLCAWNVPEMCDRALPDLVSYLSNHELKRADPAIWLAYVIRLMDLVYKTSKDHVALPPDPAAQNILLRAPDRTISLIARVRAGLR